MTRPANLKEADHLLPQEKVLRRIPSYPQFYDPLSSLPITASAFRANKHDTTGISLFRCYFATPTEVSAAGRNPNTYYVARVPLQAFSSLGLTVVPAPTYDGPRGHSVVPELAYNLDKKREKECAVALARIASADIVLHPSA